MPWRVRFLPRLPADQTLVSQPQDN
jgi:hypothetical protein